MLIRDFMDEVRPLQNFTIMKSAGSEVVLVDASDQWCGGSHQASICVVPVTQHLRTRWLHSSKFVQSCFLVYDEWVSGSFRPWTYSQLLCLSCWQTLNCEVELLVSNFKTNLWKISRSLAFSAAQILMCKSDRPHEWVAETCHRTLISWGWPFLLKKGLSVWVLLSKQDKIGVPSVRFRDPSELLWRSLSCWWFLAEEFRSNAQTTGPPQCVAWRAPFGFHHLMQRSLDLAICETSDKWWKILSGIVLKDLLLCEVAGLSSDCSAAFHGGL